MDESQKAFPLVRHLGLRIRFLQTTDIYFLTSIIRESFNLDLGLLYMSLILRRVQHGRRSITVLMEHGRHGAEQGKNRPEGVGPEQ